MKPHSYINMIFSKIIEYVLKLTGDDIYEADSEELYLGIIKKLFVGNCFASCYIVSIEKIISHSDRTISLSNDVFATVCVQFSSMVVAYDEGETIMCKILSKYSNATIAENKYAKVMIESDSSVADFGQSKNNMIPATVKASGYTVNSDHCTVIAEAFTPFKKPFVLFKLTDTDIKLTESHNLMIAEIDKCSELIPNHKYASKFFQELIYPFATKQDIKKHTKKKFNEVKNISKLSLKKGDYLTYLPSSMYKCPEIYSSNDKGEISDETIVIEISINFALDIIFNEHRKFVSLLNMLVMNYPDKKEIKVLSSTWKLYSLKK